jgi:hypothetical protein
MSLQDVILSEVRQMQKNTTSSHSNVVSKNLKYIEIENRMVITKGMEGATDMQVKSYNVAIMWDQ